MSPFAHLLASWLVAAKTTDNPRDCRLVTLAGVAPDLDGLGLVADMVQNALTHRETYYYYQTYHHYLLHGIAGAAFISAAAAAFARKRWRVFLATMGVTHLHLLCDLVGSRGPSPEDLWPIFYLGPFSKEWMWIWKDQWKLDGWQNQLVAMSLLAVSLVVAVRNGASFMGVFNRRMDAVFVGTLRNWWSRVSGKRVGGG